ncbi:MULTISPECIES: alpha-ribazole phosphatase [Veillonella]|jgi:alpha-ribazole phosphatase|uniref:Alpha-ribazole phosphatase n=1 Tax=Veillonella tobetsuensis TaxID=1110546 RepID=A0A480AZH3_9FIRM|nr:MULTISPECIES: alpha-ribazole phosphatase [Veillonella]MBF1756356.1 alpha-ribazole phosphatase [Veillonella tobetsuensis]MDU5083895.1 alpha-ribazole phosphatase [Veillonella sp.]GCL66631.1 alpha-ribazole phosphatase [Veillonella tobetsuensis]
MKTLYIVRHGETEWNKIGRYQGITNVPLNENGIAQAKACGNALKDIHFDRILSSDLSRALVTAETIRGNRQLEIKTDERLREINFGDWEKLLFTEIEERWPGLIDQMYRRPDIVKVPNGESFQEVQDRAWSAVSDFLNENNEDETILITCHGGTIRTILCKLLDISISHCWNFSQGNTAINRVFYNGMGESDHNILNLLNDTAHVDNLRGHV